MKHLFNVVLALSLLVVGCNPSGVGEVRVYLRMNQSGYTAVISQNHTDLATLKRLGDKDTVYVLDGSELTAEITYNTHTRVEYFTAVDGHTWRLP